MDKNNHQPGYIPQIGVPEKTSFQERTSTRAIYHKATAPGFFGVIVICFFMSFINIKCGGQVVASYSGYDIVTGKKNGKTNNEGSEVIPVNRSAYFSLQKAKEMFAWKRNLKEDYEAYVDDAPHFEDDFSTSDEFGKMPENFEESTNDPGKARFFTTLALISALAGLGLVFLKGKWGIFAQIITSLTGFISMMALQFYIKITMPSSNNNGSFFQSEYSTKMITTEFALGYWMVLFLFLGVCIIGFMKLRFLKRMKAATA